MRNSLILRFCAYLTFLSSASAFSVTFGHPSQCDPFAISWTGGTAPFQILVTPVYKPQINVSVPSSAFISGKGSYSIPQLALASGTQFLLTMSDATGFGSGGTTNLLTVGTPMANNNCNTANSQDFYFAMTGAAPQCNQYTFSSYANAVLPAKITGLVPGGPILVAPPVTTSNFVLTINGAPAGMELLFYMTDSRPGVGKGGVSVLYRVQPPSNSTSCLVANSPSSTTSAPSQTSSQSAPSQTSSQSAPSQTSSQSAPSQTSSQSTLSQVSGQSNPLQTSAESVPLQTINQSPPSQTSSQSPPSQTQSGSNTATVGVIAGSAVGGVVALGLLIVLGIFCKRKPSRSSDITSSRQSRRLQGKDDDFEAMQDGQVTQGFTHQTDRASRPLHPQLQSQQHLRQMSYTDSFAGSSSISSASRRMTAMGDQMTSPNTFPDQRLPVGLALPVHPGTNSHLTNMSVGNFAVKDPYDFTQIRPSHLRPNIDGFTTHASDGHSSASGQMTATAVQASAESAPNNPFPYQTASAHFASPNQPGTLSHHLSASNFTVSDGAPPLNSTQASRLSSHVDGLARHSDAGSSSMPSSGGRIAIAADQTGTNPPQIVTHVDSEDVPVAPDAQDVIDLPPQYVERHLLVAEPASVPNQKPSYS